MSRPCDGNCNVAQPGEIDPELNEFWVGSPWKIFDEHNLSAFERNRMFLNAGGRNFVDISFVSQTDDDGDGRCSLAADFNSDGRLDLAVRQAGGGPLLIYENQFPPQRFLKVTLRGVQSNRQGIGARVIASFQGRELVRDCFPANSYLSQSPLTVHFGLGEADHVDRLRILWPAGAQTELLDVPADRHIVVREGVAEVEFTEAGTTWAP